MLIKVHADPKHHAEVPAWWFVVVVYACMHLLCYVSVLFCSICLFLLEYSQLKWLVDIFRAKIVDISEHSVTIEVIAGHLLICFNF